MIAELRHIQPQLQDRDNVLDPQVRLLLNQVSFTLARKLQYLDDEDPLWVAHVVPQIPTKETQLEAKIQRKVKVTFLQRLYVSSNKVIVS